MLMTQPALRITEQAETRPRFDRFAWERWLISSGAMAKLKPAERAVLWMMTIAADKQGESYWSLPRLAEATGYQDKAGECRAVRNARRDLASAGLIELVEQGGGKRASRYRIVMHEAQGRTAPHDHPGTHVPETPDPGTSVPPTPERTFPPARNERSGVTAHRTNHRTAAAVRDAPGGSDVALWDSPSATSRAAAAALVDFGFSAKEAAGIVSQHRPTAEQVRNVIANARGWQDQHAKGRRKDPLKFPKRFVRKQIASKEFELDAAVSAEQQREDRQAKSREVQREVGRLDEAWAALSTADRERLRARVLEMIRADCPRKAAYYEKARAQDEPLRSLIARMAMAEHAKIGDTQCRD